MITVTVIVIIGIAGYNYNLILNDKEFPKIAGYRGSTFDGESMYFAPYYNNYGRHGIMLKYDTSQDFTDINSWQIFNVESILDVNGFQGVLYNDNFVYYVPYFTEPDKEGTSMLRYDVTLPFDNVASWEAVGFFGMYEDGVVDKNYIYYSPHLDSKGDRHTFPLRYNTEVPFSYKTSWESFDTGINASYIGATSDGEKIYFTPWWSNDEEGSSIMTYNTALPFLEKESWSYISIPDSGYSGAGFNGTHIVFAPCWCDGNIHKNQKIMFLNIETQSITYSEHDYGSYHGVIEVDDTLYLSPYVMNNGTNSDFLKITNSITTFNPLISKGGYWGGSYDGQYVYYVPYETAGNIRIGDFLRYDTTKPFTNYDSWESMSFQITNFNYNFEDPFFLNEW